MECKKRILRECSCFFLYILNEFGKRDKMGGMPLSDFQGRSSRHPSPSPSIWTPAWAKII